jgi:hypothetical protein
VKNGNKRIRRELAGCQQETSCVSAARANPRSPFNVFRDGIFAMATSEARQEAAGNFTWDRVQKRTPLIVGRSSAYV